MSKKTQLNEYAVSAADIYTKMSNLFNENWQKAGKTLTEQCLLLNKAGDELYVPLKVAKKFVMLKETKEEK